MAETMYDSVTAADIPANATIVGGYVDGGPGIQWTPEDWGRFGGATIIRIATHAGTNDGNELDVETGAATPAQAPGWVNMRVASGVPKVSIYMNRATWPAVQAAVNGAGLGDKVVYRVAEWNGAPHSIPGAWAVQYAAPNTGSGGHWDLNTVDDLSWLHGGGGASGASGPRILQLATPDMTGDDVRQLQVQLNAHGASLSTDGDFGPQTDAAVRAFQDGHGLEVDGVVGPLTWAAFRA